MNHSPFWPLVWKEYRAGRPFWLSMAAMGILAQASVWRLAHPSGGRDWWLYGIAWMIPAAFAVGIGGTLFAAEHEERTFGLLRVLPLRAKELGGAKLLTALVGLGTLLVALWMTAAFMAGWQALPVSEAGHLRGLWGLACAEGLAWGILCSLVIRSPLRATVTAVMAVTLSIQAAVTLTRTHDLWKLASYSEAIPLRLALLLAVAALDAWLMPRWLAGRLPRPADRSRTKNDGPQDASGAWQTPAPGWAAPLGRLMWQTWCETAGNAWRLVGIVVAIAMACAAAIALLAFGVLDFGQVHLEPPLVGGLRLVPYFLLLPLVILAVLAGTLTFALDPTLRARFLAERGVSPRLVWLSRQIVWGGWLWLLLGVAGILTIAPRLVPPPTGTTPAARHWPMPDCDYVTFGTEYSFLAHPAAFRVSTNDVAVNAWLLWGTLFSAFAVAQLMSMLVRRRLLAAVFALVLGVPAAGWVYLMFAIDVPWWSSALPLAVASLVATWLRAPAWMFGRATWTNWLAPVAVMAGSLVWVGASVPFYRVDEIPVVTFRWPADDRPTADLADVGKAIDLYRRASDLYRADYDLKRPYRLTDADAGQIVDLLREAAAYPADWLPAQPATSFRAAADIEPLARGLLSWGQGRQANGQLEQALDCYLIVLRMANHFDQCSPKLDRGGFRGAALADIRCWAAAPGQTADQIRAAMRRLEAAHAAQVSPTVRLRTWYEAMLLAIRDLPAALAAGVGPAHVREAQWLTSRLPWERERATRLLDLVTAYELHSLDQLGQRLNANETLNVSPIFERDWDGGLHVRLDRHGHDPLGQLGRQPLDQWLRTTPLIDGAKIPVNALTWLPAEEETNYRASLIVLGLEAWRIEHGQLPERLDELAPAELALLPLDPLFAEPFLYYPHGTAEQDGNFIVLTANPEEARRVSPDRKFSPEIESNARIIGPHPFLWSALSPIEGEQRIVAFASAEKGVTGAIAYGVEPPPQGPPVFETGILAAGRAYRIVEPEKEQP